MADSCENNEKTLACSQHIVFLHHACCAGAKIHHRKKSACYVMSNRASELVGSSVVSNCNGYCFLKGREFLDKLGSCYLLNKDFVPCT